MVSGVRTVAVVVEQSVLQRSRKFLFRDGTSQPSICSRRVIRVIFVCVFLGKNQGKVVSE